MKIIQYMKNLRKAYLSKTKATHYSQFGEDIIIKEIIGKQKNGFFIDVGCFHPRKFSNTYGLYKKGWNGLNIDMEEHKIQLFNMRRKRDINVIAAISNERKKVTIFKDREFDLGTTINEKLGEKGKKKIKNEVHTQTLNEILSQHEINEKIDLLSIDAEGEDYNVLCSINLSKYKPKIIIIESHLENIEDILSSQIYKTLTSNNYTLRSWNYYSLIFVLRKKEEGNP